MEFKDEHFCFTDFQARVVAVMHMMGRSLGRKKFFLAEIGNHYDAGLGVKNAKESPSTLEFHNCLCQLQKKGIAFWYKNTTNPSYTPGRWSLEPSENE